MASKEHKIVRRAQVLSELDRLSGLLAEGFKIEVISTQVNNRDSELAEIQRIENINALLTRMLEVGSVATEKTVDDAGKKPGTRSLKHGANK